MMGYLPLSPQPIAYFAPRGDVFSSLGQHINHGTFERPVPTFELFEGIKKGRLFCSNLGILVSTPRRIISSFGGPHLPTPQRRRRLWMVPKESGFFWY